MHGHLSGNPPSDSSNLALSSPNACQTFLPPFDSEAGDGVDQDLRYCRSTGDREQMTSFLARAFEIERVYPQIPLLVGPNPWCTKDGFACFASITIPFRSQYEVRKGFYEVGGDSIAASAHLEILLNGLPVALEALPVMEIESRSERLFKGTTGLAPGTHRFEVRWYWKGVLEHTTIVFVTVQT